MLQPDDTKEDGTPIFDGFQFDSPSELCHLLQAGGLPVPCWIRIGRTSMRVTEEGLPELTRGILLAELLRAHLREE